MAKHGRYKIARKVADGGMAEIFLATQLGHEGFAKPVILKRIHSSIYSDPQFRNMFIDEAHISMSLSHSNIVQILDLGVGNGRYFLVLEFIDGWDLGRVLHRGATSGMMLPRELGLHIVGDVCRALAYAHAKSAPSPEGERPLGIVHRDVSPHNILLSEQGEVKLTDFGIAKAMNKREHTGTGVVKGKVAFMSPEQALGRPIDARSDLFALGTVLYLLMTRVRPFSGHTDLETLLRVQKNDYRPASQAAPDLPIEVVSIIARAMRLDPAERYQSADEMLVDIEHVARTVFQPVGQTELKRYLATLSARDGVPSIGKATPGPPTARPGTGSGELEGKDVVLLDSSKEYDDDVTEEDEIVDGEDATSLAVVGPSGTPEKRRVTRAAHEELTVIPDDAEAALSGRRSRSEFALPIPDEVEGRPGRRRARRGGGLWIVVFGLLLVGGAYAVGHFLGIRKDVDASDKGAPAHDLTGAPPATAPGAPPAAAAGTEAAHAEPAAAAAQEPVPPGEARGHADEKAAAKHVAEAAADHEREHESAARRAPHAAAPAAAATAPAPTERPHRGIEDLKAMMAPDPSQLPAPTPPSPPRPSEPPPPPPPSSAPANP